MILRLVIAALLLYLLFVLIYSSLTGRRRKRKGNAEMQPGDSMVLDPHCKSYVPKKDAYAHKGHYFCSKECAQAYLGA